jgi:methylsterol monooxygenase
MSAAVAASSSSWLEPAYRWYLHALKDEFGFSNEAVFVFTTWLMHELTNWSFQAFLFTCYRFDLFPKQRIQGKHFPSADLVWAAVKNSLISKTLFGFVGTLAIVKTTPFLSFVDIDGPIPPWYTFAWQFVVAWLFLDFMFYWSHRAFHTPYLYKTIHKRHHAFNDTVGIAYSYAHPIEDIFVNSLPTLLSLLITRMHLAHWAVFLVLRIAETIDAHSGYEFDWSPWRGIFGGSERHWFHHAKNAGNFGILNIWDPLMKTDAAYNRWKEEQQQKSKKDAGKSE